jgi:DNA-binding beta-propeller fold protein YncE
VDAPFGTVLVLGPRSVIALESATGATAFRLAGIFPTSMLVGSSVAALDLATQHLFVIEVTGQQPSVVFSMMTLDARTGAVLRRTPLAQYERPMDLALDSASGRIYLSTFRAKDPYAQNPAGRIAVFDTRSGTLLASDDAAGGAHYQLGVDTRHGRLVTETLAGLRLLDSRTGAVLHTSPLEDSGPLAVDSATGRALVAGTTDAGILQLFSTESGAQIARLSYQPQPAQVLDDAADGLLLILVQSTINSKGILTVVDGRSGRVVHTIQEGGVYAGPMVLDPGHHRLLVGNPGEGTIAAYDLQTLR